MRRLGIALLIAAALLSAPRSGLWRIVGPGGGGAQFHPTVSPHDPNRVLVACDMTGSYITEDAGASWRMFNLRGTTMFFEWDPNDPKVIYAGNNGLYRSADAGQTWRLIYPTPREITGIDMASDHAEEAIIANGRVSGRVGALAVDPANSKALYVLVGSSLFVSPDAGGTWQYDREFPPPVRRLWVSGKTLYVAGDRFFWIRENGKWSQGQSVSEPWIDLSASLPAGQSRAPQSVFYAISDTAGHVSDDGGKTWRGFALPGAGAHLHAVATSLRHPDTAYVSYSRLQVDGQSWFGVAKTVDRGRTWTLVWKEDAKPAPNVHDAWMTERFGPTWAGQPISLGVAPTDPDICYGTDFGRTMRTTDGGKTWNAVYSKRAANGWTSTGLDVTTNYRVHFDPFDARRMFITYTDIGAFRSEDGGESWVSSTEGVPSAWVNTTYWMAFDPEVRGRVWAVASGTHDLPRPKMWRRNETSRYRGGVVRSDDGGRTWRQANNGMVETAATHILIDPKSPKDGRVLYVAAFGRGVYKSTDGGASWSLKNQGIAGAAPFVWRLAEDRNGGLYAVLARASENGAIGNADDGALYFSADAAEHWKPVTLPQGVNGPNSVTVDPDDPKRLYLSVWRRATHDADGGGGVYLSTDSGATWRRVLDKDQHVYDVTVDPRNPHLVYACGFESSAWRSTDRGETWQRIRGYNFKWGHRVIPDPSNAALIYVTTFGGGVWHGPAAGDPNAAEDIVGAMSLIK